jgi:hypothetical protein
MLIYGWRATCVASQNINTQCSECSANNSLSMHVFQQYLHIFWIPIFPFRKTGSSECSNCKQVLQKKDFSEELKEKYSQLKSISKTPFWTFTGVLLIIVIAIFMNFEEAENSKKNASLILTPMEGDVYEIKLGREEFTLYKVDFISGDTVYFRTHNYVSNQAGFDDLKAKGEEFSDELVYLIKSDLAELLNDGSILNIERGRKE